MNLTRRSHGATTWPAPDAAEKTELWRRWRRGESLNAIGRALGRIAHVVRYEVARTGGIPPPARQRSRLALTLTEREAISRGRASGTSVRQISRQLRRAPSTVSREVCRHGGRRRYRAATADAVAWARGRRPKRCRLATHPALRDAVATKLTQKWSPQQIAGWLRRAYPDDPTMHVSHETIYLSLFVQPRRAQEGTASTVAPAAHDPAAAYRTTAFGRVHRRGRLDSGAPRHRRGPRRPGALGGRSPRRRPAVLRGDAGRAVLALRLSRPCVGARDADGRPSAHAARKAVARRAHGHAHLGSGPRTGGPSYLLNRHRRAGLLLRSVQSVAGGTNENTNGLLRQYLPKGTDLARYTQAQLNKIARALNTRPRKTLGYRTPADILADTVALTG